MGDPCLRCPHEEADHDDQLGICLADGCLCLGYVSEADELEVMLGSGEEPEELDFSEGDER
jgi:hypothetical protein